MPPKIQKYIFPVVAGLLFAYSAIRAYHLSFTIDEASTYLNYCLGSYHDIFYPVLLDANNHVLNSFLMKLLSSILPVNELTLRLPSLIAHILYLWFTWQLLKDIKNTWVKNLLYLFINTNPFMLDFFSLARGYALSWGLMAGSLYYLKSYLEKKDKRISNIGLSFLFSALASLASFSVLNYYMALLAVYILIVVYDFCFNRQKIEKSLSFWVGFGLVVGITVPFLYYSINYLLALNAANALVLGGKTGFFQDTIISIIACSNYGLHYPDFLYTLLEIFFVAAPLACIVFIIRSTFIRKKSTDLYTSFTVYISKKNKEGYAFFMALFTIFMLIALGITVQFYVLGTLFIIQRAALFILVIFMLLVSLLLHYYSKKLWAQGFLVLMVGFCFIHFARAANFAYAREWRYNADAKTMMHDLGEIQKNAPYKGQPVILLHPFWALNSSCAFYKNIYDYKWLQLTEKMDPVTRFEDFFYCPDTSLGQFHDMKIEVVKRYPLSSSVLVKNLSKKVIKVLETNVINMPDTLTHNPGLKKFFSLETFDNVSCIKVHKTDFAPTAAFDAHKFADKKDVHVKTVARVNFDQGIKGGDLVISVYDKAGKVLIWHALNFSKALPQQQKGWMTVPFEADLGKIDSNADLIKVFVWNTGANDIFIADMKTEISEQ